MSEALAQPLPAATAKPDAETFEALYERTFPRVYAYVASLLRDRSAAEDVTAQAFERACRKRRGYRPSRGSAEAWLFASRATPRSMSCAAASAAPPLRARRAGGPGARPHRLRDALRDLSALGKVRSRSESGQDVTAAVVGAGDRLESARAERASLLRRLRRAGSDTQAETLRQRLDANSIEIRRLRNDLRSLWLRTNYAAVSVTISDGSRGDVIGGPEDSTADALDDAVASLQASLHFALRALGVLLPLGLMLAALWFGGRAVMRRRRESAPA